MPHGLQRSSTAFPAAPSGLRGYAGVADDAIVYRGVRVSPRQLTIAIAGAGRNAWRELWLLLSGESKWKLASMPKPRWSCR